MFNWVLSHFAESHFAESHFAESHFAESHFAESHFAEYHLAEYHFAESHFGWRLDPYFNSTTAPPRCRRSTARNAKKRCFLFWFVPFVLICRYQRYIKLFKRSCDYNNIYIHDDDGSKWGFRMALFHWSIVPIIICNVEGGRHTQLVI